MFFAVALSAARKAFPDEVGDDEPPLPA